MKNKILIAGLTLVIATGLLAGCSSNEPADSVKQQQTSLKPAKEVRYKDGIYFAQEDKFNEKNGWKNVVSLEIKDGKIVSVDWNGIHKNGGTDKKTLSKNGQYPMVEKGGAKAPWHEQAARVEAYLLETQDPTAIQYIDDEGHTDAISGVSIHVNEFFELAKQALSKATR